MTRQSFIPEYNKVHLFDKHCVLFFESGYGVFQVDFKNYQFSTRRAVFLAPGQYFQLISGQFQITLFEFPGDEIAQTYNSRFLFKHLVSLGYIDLSQPDLFHLKSLQSLDLSTRKPDLLDDAIDEWISQNPFQATSSEVNLLFDLKDIVDEEYREPLSIDEISRRVREKPYKINEVTKRKLQTTLKKLAHGKLLLEAQRKLVFTDWTTKEIAYELGFYDPPYFNRFFKANTRRTPYEFRSNFDSDETPTLIRDLSTLIDFYYAEHHEIGFYADQLNLTVKTLSRKVKEKTTLSVHDLIKEKILKESQRLLQSDVPIHEIAFALGFREANHFSNFFKVNTGQTPSNFRDRQLQPSL